MTSSAHPAPIHTPRYLLRRRIILHALRRVRHGSFLEVGCGRGELLPWLDQLGFRGLGLEISDAVLPSAYAAAAPLEPRIRVVSSIEEVGEQSFDYVMSFEVLEHIEADRATLEDWLRHLAPDGRFVCTVPAHMKLWSASDEAVGHVRRYERDDVLRLLDSVGLEPEKIWSYGYPLVLVTRPLRHVFYRLRRKSWDQHSKLDRTLTSSTDSTVFLPGPLRGLARLLVNTVGLVFHYLGLPLRKTDWGDGYLVVARWRS